MTDNTDGIEMTADDIFEKLLERPSNWRELLEKIPYDPEFSSLYEPLPGEPVKAFLAERYVFWFRPETLSWDRTPNVVRWLLENPRREWQGVAGLYEHAQGIDGSKSPWLLFQYITGIAETSQGMGLNSLMGIGTEDAVHLSDALHCWHMDRNDVETFVELIMLFERMGSDE